MMRRRHVIHAYVSLESGYREIIAHVIAQLSSKFHVELVK